MIIPNAFPGLQTVEIEKDALFHTPKCGYLSLQIPEIHIGDGAQNSKLLTVPTDWFIRVQCYKSCKCGNTDFDFFSYKLAKNGCLWWSKNGYIINKMPIKRAFLSSKNPRGTWKDFEAMAECFYDTLVNVVVTKTINKVY
jgi:predicted nucleic-acid-binding Zn-ribbon protein